MCGSLKHEKLAKKIGDLVVVSNPFDNSTRKVFWSGFIQVERLNWWVQQGPIQQMRILADSFTEKDHEFEVPGGAIVAGYLRNDVVANGKLVGKAGTVKIITRKAITELEKRLHHRWPLVRYPTPDEVHKFTNKDLIVGQLNLH